jgi:hypothetical protein
MPQLTITESRTTPRTRTARNAWSRVDGLRGTGRHDPAFPSLCLTGLRHSSACRTTGSFMSEQIQRILNPRGFGVQVPGGAPSLTWDFITSSHFCVRFAPWLLARTDPPIRGLSKTGRQAPGESHSPRSWTVSYGRRRPCPLDQWSRPIAAGTGSAPGVPILMPSRSAPLGVPGKLGRGRPQPGWMLGAGGNCRRRVRSCPHGEQCAPGTAHGRAPLTSGTGDAGKERSRAQVPASGALLRKADT